MKRGFTLIELSIVLVIIGLIVGGILVGRDLIKAAEIRKQISEFEKLSAAINTFKLKYNCLPGDCINYQALGFTSCVANNFLGDGLINRENYGGGTGAGSFSFRAETLPTFRQLSQIGLIPGSYLTTTNLDNACVGSVVRAQDFPAQINNKAGYMVLSLYGRNYIRTGISNGRFSNVAIESYSDTYGSTPLEAQMISQKMSDGTPGIQGGKFYAAGAGSGPVPSHNINTEPTFSAAGGTGCVVGASPLAAGQAFNVSNPDYVCNLFIALQ